jgi:proton-coupled amino acid transporter
MPLYRAMKEKKNFNKLFGVLNASILILILLYCAAGFLGYLRYGDDVEASVTLSLPDEALYNSVQLMYAIAVIFTYPIILYVPIEMLWPNIKSKLRELKKSETTIEATNYFFRALLVTLTCKWNHNFHSITNYRFYVIWKINFNS